MSISISQQAQSLKAQIAHANKKIVALKKKLLALDDELANRLNQRAQYQLLDEICSSLDKLHGMGASHLFWEARSDPEKQLQQARATVVAFRQNISAFERVRSALQAEIQDELYSVSLLNDQLAELQELAEDALNERELEHLDGMPYRATAMPWSMQGEDEQLFRKILFGILFLALAFGGLVPIFRPPVEKSMGIVVPDRIVQIIRKKQEAKSAEQKLPEKPAEKKDGKEKTDKKPDEKMAEEKIETPPPKDTPKQIPADAQMARSTAETKGVLAFKNNFADLLKDSSPLKIGATARISNNANRTTGDAPQRSIITSQAISGSGGNGGSGGIDVHSLNRQSEGNVGQRMADNDVKIARIESTVHTGASEDKDLMDKGVQPSRTDEEIQIVFDRYKSALYRIYNRELRINPALRGKMVLRITIEPDGRVSACTVKSTDLDSPALSADIVDRVLKFNFGPKENAPAATILYPIDFLPAT